MTVPAGPGEWDLALLRQLVAQNDLERARIEYKRDLSGGIKVLEAIAALANTFGGVVLIGVDEGKQGADRLCGVEGSARDRLARMCWDTLVAIQPGDRPNQTRPVREVRSGCACGPCLRPQAGHGLSGEQSPGTHRGPRRPADWYRLRDLFAEDQADNPPPALPPAGNFVATPGMSHPDLGCAAACCSPGHGDAAVTSASRRGPRS